MKYRQQNRAEDETLDSLAFVVWGDPVGKARPRVLREGRTYTPPKSAAYDKMIRQAALSEARGQRFPEGVQLHMEVFVKVRIPKSEPKKVAKDMPFCGVTRRPDIDNYLKAVMDGVQDTPKQRGVISDDSQITHVTISKTWAADEPGLAVHIKSSSGADRLMVAV